MRPETPHASYTLVKFVDDDAGFAEWKRQNPKGYVVNCPRHPSAKSVVLHLSHCPSLERSRTSESIKVCSDHRSVLDSWARSTVHTDVRDCRICHPRG